MFGKLSKKRISNANLHFTSSLSLEQAAQQIASLADANHHIDLIEISPDRISFKINYTLNRTDEGKIQGTLKRWNHHETIVECKGKIVPKPSLTGTLLKGGCFLAVFTIIAMVIGETFFDTYCSQSSVCDFFYAFMVSVTFVILVAAIWINQLSDNKNKGVELDFRERDRLFQLIIDSFKSQGDVQAL